MEINLQGVWTVLQYQELLPPSFFWQTLYSNVEEILYDMGYDFPELKPWQQYILFAWRSRSNCFYCYFQRQYEFVGLYEHYPDLFWKSWYMERTVGSSEYTWLNGRSMDYILTNRDKIRRKRAHYVADQVLKIGEHDLIGEPLSELSLISCGLLCGK